MIEARWAGKTLDEIGADFGITRERVRQILKKHDGPAVSDIRKLREDDAAASLARSSDSIRQFVTNAGPASVEDVGAALGMPTKLVAQLWPRDVAHLRLRPVDWIAQAWSEESILLAIRSASIYEFPLTAIAYTELVRVGQVVGPSLPRIAQRFGSWAKACEAAGVEHGQSRADYQSRWTDGDLLTYARRYLKDPSGTGSIGGYDPWKRENAPEAPSAMTLRNRLGGWSQVKKRALGQEDEVAE